MADGDGVRLSISEEKLDAALAKMELRLRIFLEEQLKGKADAGPFVTLALKVDALDRGDFTKVHERALNDFIEKHLAEVQDTAWTSRERFLYTIGSVVTIMAFVVSLYFGVSTARGAIHASSGQGVTHVEPRQ